MRGLLETLDAARGRAHGYPSLIVCNSKKCWTPICFSTLDSFIRLPTFRRCGTPKTEKIKKARNCCSKLPHFVHSSMGAVFTPVQPAHWSHRRPLTALLFPWHQNWEWNWMKSVKLVVNGPCELQKVVFFNSRGKLMLTFKLSRVFW